MVGSKCFLSLLAVGTAASLVGCYGIPSFPPYKAPRHYVWDRQTFDYRPPINTWAEYPEMAESLRRDVEQEERKTATTNQTNTEDIVVTILERAGYRCVSRKEPSGCKTCQVCTNVEPGYANVEEPQIDMRQQAMGTITTTVYVGPGSDVRALTYWKRPPVQLKKSP
ncbi:MAG: hypothetical protein J0H44_15395 [Alphaproteobacteria bacterium]|nr:hypothetical protein [Alphaproteobacteria bacterium]